MDYQELLEQVVKIRNSPQIEDRDDVPMTLPVGAAVGTEILIPLAGRNIRTLVHTPAAKQGRYPVYFNFHGGGMVAGSPEMDEFICERICNALSCVVVNVEYRLAPEHPFPHGLEDCYDVITSMLHEADRYSIDPDKAAVGGQSAGGNLAAAAAIMANRRQEFRLKGQIMVYAAMSFDENGRKNRSQALPANVVRKSSAWLYHECYGFGGADLSDPLASPINARAEDLSGLPQALIITAELDSLAIDAEQYALELIRAGTHVQAKRFLGCVHGFTHRGYTEEPDLAIQLMIDFLRGCFA